MILDTHYNWFLDYYVKSSWANPSLETNITLTPTLLNYKFPTYGSFNFMRSTYLMPKMGVAYDLYTLNYIPPNVFRYSKRTVGSWVSISDFCQTTNTALYIDYRDALFTALYSEAYLMYMNNGTTLLAIPNKGSAYRNKLNINIRSSNDDLNNIVNIKETNITSMNVLVEWFNAYTLDNYTEFKQYYVNGYWIPKPVRDDIKVGDVITTITDSGTKEVLDFNLATLPMFVKDDSNFHLVKASSDTTNKFINREDIIYYLVNGNLGKRLILDKDNLKQVTDNEIGIKASFIEAVLSSLGWIEQDTTLRLYTKDSNPNQFYVNNENYLASLNNLTSELRERCLVGSLSCPNVLTASYLVDNVVNQGLETQYHNLTKEKLDEVIEISTWDYYINRVYLKGSEVNNDLSNIVTKPGGELAIASIVNGYVNEIKPDTIDDSVTMVVVGHRTPTEIKFGNGANISTMESPAVYSRLQGELELLTLGDDYSVISDEVRVKSGYGDIYTLDLNSSLVVELDPDVKVVDLPLVEFLDELGTITILADNKTLVPTIDYKVGGGKIAFAQSAYYSKLTLVFQPNLSAKEDLIEVGFTSNYSLSIDSRYVEVDPNNTTFNVGGKLLFPNEIRWDVSYVRSEDDMENAVPYAIFKHQLSCSNLSSTELKSKRDNYEANLDLIARFKDINVPKPEITPSLYPEQYRLTSIFMYQVYHDAVAGVINTNPSTVAALGLDTLLADYLYLLEDDLDIINSNLDWNLVELRGHYDDLPLAVNGNLFNLLRKVNETYLNNRVYLNNNFRITA